LKNDRSGFTLIEVLVSVVILSIATVSFMSLQSQHISSIGNLISKKTSLYENTLFFDKINDTNTNMTTDAYTVLQSIGITNDDTKNILQSIKKEIIIQKPINDMELNLTKKAIIKDINSSSSYNF